MGRGFFCAGGLFLAIPGTLHAQDDMRSEAGDRDEIIVTGERIPRPDLETASSVAVFTPGQIEASAADRIDQILALVPNIQPGSGEEGPAIRGQDSTGQLRNLFAFLGGARPRVTLQVDGRPVSFYEFISGTQSAWDLKQVEVFRSPQTTTQGRNSIAGAIFVETADPTQEWEGRGRVMAGNIGMRQVSAAVGGPIADGELAFRLSGDLHLGRVANAMTDGIDGAELEHDDYGTARFKLLYQPAFLPRARLETTVSYSQSQSPQFEGASPPFSERRLPVPNQMIGVMRVRATSLTTRAEYEIEPGLTSALTISYGDALLRRFGLPGLGRTRAEVDDFTIEPTLLWQRPGEFTLLLGANRSAIDQQQTINISGFGLGTGTFDDEQDSLGLFAEANWYLLPSLSLTGGLRYQTDRQVRVGGIGGIVLDYDETFSAWLPKLSVAWEPSETITLGLVAQRAFNPGGTTISLARRGADDFEAERLWNYEAFFRARFAGGKATLAANLFYADIENAQRPQLVPIVLPNGIPTQATEFSNAPEAHSYGLEAELGWKLSGNFSVRAGIGLLKTRVDRTEEPGDPTLGNSFQRSPGLSLSGAIDWRPVEPLELSTQIRHQSGYFSDDANTQALRIGASTIVDARASYDFGRIQLVAYARNLLDQFTITNLFNPNFASTGRPREIGIGVEASF